MLVDEILSFGGVKLLRFFSGGNPTLCGAHFSPSSVKRGFFHLRNSAERCAEVFVKLPISQSVVPSRWIIYQMRTPA